MHPLEAFSLAAVLALTTLAMVPACSSDTTADLHPASASGGTPAGQPRSFTKDVVPILVQQCALSSCHGNPDNKAVGIHFRLGDSEAIFAELQKESPTAKGAKFVVARDPAKSYMLAKMTGDQDSFSAACGAPGCGAIMPPGGKLPTTQRDTVQQWITEGAVKN